MRLRSGVLSVILGMLLLSSSPWVADDADADWKVDLGYDLRTRYEGVEDDGFARDANAWTVRSALFVQARWSAGWNGLVEFEDVRPITDQRFNSTANGNTTFPVVADPKGTELNRLWVGWGGGPDLVVRLGRQRILRDGSRFLGTVAWRQNEQTHDGVSVERTSGRWRFYSAYTTRANRIFGSNHPDPLLRRFDLNGYVGETAMHVPAGTLSADLHFLEFENAPTVSHRNLGLRWEGKQSAGKGEIRYRAQWIEQDSYADAPDTNDARYTGLIVGYHADRWSVSLEEERLGGDGTYAFQRPLATLHAFNGWADRFLTTPADGLVDRIVTGRYRHAQWTFSALFHRYEADEGSAHYGDEIGLAVSRKIGSRCSALVKYADYDADTFSVDVRKAWVMFQIKDKLKMR